MVKPAIILESRRADCDGVVWVRDIKYQAPEEYADCLIRVDARREMFYPYGQKLSINGLPLKRANADILE